MKYTEYKRLDLPEIGNEIKKFWDENRIFDKSLTTREGHKPFVFYEGPPSANGKPGIHHVLARTIKDLICRYQTLKGRYVARKGGWDTHGLPVELGVEQKLGITKEDIGKTISVEDYNRECRREVMKYKDMWEELTREMGYWVDMEHPYITFDNKYIETEWYLLSELYKKGLLYKGYSIQPYSPAAGTGLSSHELNLPGCYKDVKDTTCTALFKIKKQQTGPLPFGWQEIPDNLYFVAWTTTPWTLPSNTALAVGPKIVYTSIQTFNPYSGEPIMIVMAKNLIQSYFKAEQAELSFEHYKQGDKKIPYRILREDTGNHLTGLEYEQLIPYMQPAAGAFRVISGDYVTTEDGTGIVHIAPTFGADDKRVAQEAGVPPMTVTDRNGILCPMVDKTGKFFPIEDLDPQFVRQSVNVPLYQTVAGRYVKPDYEKEDEKHEESLDVQICMWLKQEHKVFKIEKHVHNYPHCWRTDKPVLYYPLDSWFIKTTAFKEKMAALNDTVQWKPTTTGTGRFGNWLENLVDWNLSRSRFWGVPLPIWTTEDKKEQICIGSIAQLIEEIEKAVRAGIMKENPFKDFKVGDYSEDNYARIDLHKPYVDEIFLISPSGKKMTRENDLIDVWFDSGSMPYSQWHYPFENQEVFKNNFPADFIAEGVDQTRGWFFTLHAIASMLFDSVAYQSVISNGLILDKNGNKMSKRLNNAVDPFVILKKYGPDALRWYMITNTSPWENLKFDETAIGEIQRKFFGTLYNTYNFFALYANIDGFTYKEPDLACEKRPEIDRWILSELNTLVKHCDACYADYDPTKAGREIQDFVDACLSNWYVRLSRRRFWKGEYSDDKISAYQTLYICMTTLAKIASPIAPFFMDKLYLDLNRITHKESFESVHLAEFPTVRETWIDKSLEERMQLARQLSSMVLSLRKKSNVKVRQPLRKIMIPALDDEFVRQINRVKDLILHEVNVKELVFVQNEEGVFVKRIKPDYKKLGPKYGKMMKNVAAKTGEMSQAQIAQLEKDGSINFDIDGQNVEILIEDVEIVAEDIPGWIVAHQDALTVALDIEIDENLQYEGYAREFVKQVQTCRKDSQFDVQDRITITVENNPQLTPALQAFASYIQNETLCTSLQFADTVPDACELDMEDIKLKAAIRKV